jgi:hypothetical protein
MREKLAKKLYARRQWDDEFGKIIPPHQRKKTQQKEKI